MAKKEKIERICAECAGTAALEELGEVGEDKCSLCGKKTTVAFLKPPLEEEKRCRVCGCTDSAPCIDDATGEPCHWKADDLCSSCWEKQ